MSRRVTPVARSASCHICQKAGESIQMVASHNFRDPKGRVVCPIFLQKLKNNKCHLCDNTGHFSDKCPNPFAEAVYEIESMKKVLIKPSLEKNSSIKKLNSNRWVTLTTDGDSSDEDNYAKIAPNVTVRNRLRGNAMKMNWADMSDDEEEEEENINKSTPWYKK